MSVSHSSRDFEQIVGYVNVQFRAKVLQVDTFESPQHVKCGIKHEPG